MTKDILKVEVKIDADGIIEALNEINKSIKALTAKLNDLNSPTVNINTSNMHDDIDVNEVVAKINEALEKKLSSSI